jgi:hypothetical protein
MVASEAPARLLSLKLDGMLTISRETTGMNHKQTTAGKRNYSEVDIEKNISSSGRGEAFFLTSLPRN